MLVLKLQVQFNGVTPEADVPHGLRRIAEGQGET
jgi:hypothetical protein